MIQLWLKILKREIFNMWCFLLCQPTYIKLKLIFEIINAQKLQDACLSNKARPLSDLAAALTSLASQNLKCRQHMHTPLYLLSKE